MEVRPDSGAGHIPGSGLETTAHLLSLVRAGDASAQDRLVRRYLPALKRWAHGRLPGYARDLIDTDDLVQISLVKALDHLKGFEPQRVGAFLAYLRRILMHQIVDEIRRARRRPVHEELVDEPEGIGPTPLEQAIGRQALEAYESALAQLPEEQQEAVVMRIEMGFSYPQVAEALGSPSANAARMMITRALMHLAELIEQRGQA